MKGLGRGIGESGLCRGAGIGDPIARRPERSETLCLHCRRPVEKIDGEWACRLCRKKPVSTVEWPGMVMPAVEQVWNPEP